MVTVIENVTAGYVSTVDFRLASNRADCFGEPGAPIEDSVFFRAYCYLCGEPIRVPRKMLSFPNACSGCRPDYRGRPEVIEAERNFYFEQFQQDRADRAEAMNG